MPKKRKTQLRDLQHFTMLAVARLREEAFGSAIRDELLRVSEREVSVATVFVTLARLEDQGLVKSTSLEPDPERGGRGSRVFELTPGGWGALRASQEALAKMWEGVKPA